MTPKSRVVLLTELHLLFDRQMLPAPANRIAPNIAPCGASGTSAPAMNRLPSVHTMPWPPQRMAPSRTAELPVERSLGVASVAPIWAWAGSQGAAHSPSIARTSQAIKPAVRAAELSEAQACLTAPFEAMEAIRETETAHGGCDVVNSVQNASEGQDAHDRPREVRIPGEVLREMAAMAAQTGRRESELWAEAAREWLDRQAPGDDPPPTAAALAPSPASRASRDRCWGAIDILLSDLRAPNHPPIPIVAGRRGSWGGSAA